jgi:threonine/homoserine/homoserine lactone efflux protein
MLSRAHNRVAVISHFAAFLGVSIVVIVTPGPDTALTIRGALLGGRRGGVLTAAGVITGQAAWAAFTAAGIAALLRASQPAFLAIRVLGAGYLLYLGLQALIAALRGRSSTALATDGHGGRATSAAAFRQGLFSNLSNPKMAVFFISVMPQFVGDHGSFVTMLLLGLVFCSLTFIWLTAYATAVAKTGDLLRRTTIRRVLDGLTGAALVVLGVRLVSEQR